MIELSIADLLFGQVLCVHPDKLATVLSVLSRRLHITSAEGIELNTSLAYVPETFAAPGGSQQAGSGQWQDVGHGVALLPISGSLVARTRGLDTMSGLQSYRQIGSDFEGLMQDDSVQHIILQISSPGGSTNSLPDLVDQIEAARGVKPVTALIDDEAYSAAYWIASAADEIVMSRTGGAGSIGAMGVHVDRSGANEQAGIKVTALTSGKRKALLSPHAPLADDARAELQALVDEMGSMFIDGVARLRGLSASDVRALEAGTLHGQAAIAAGLADRIAPAMTAIREIRDRYASNRVQAPAQQAGRIQRQAKAMAMRMD